MAMPRSWIRAAILSVSILLPSAAQATLSGSAAEAVVWLEAVQNRDGSWGKTPDVRAAFTSEAVVALRAYGRNGPVYRRGVAWLASRAMTSNDARARRIVSTVARGDNVSADQARIQAAYSTDGFSASGSASGWGLNGDQGPSALDTGLVLQAYGALGVPAPVLSNATQAVSFLTGSQVANAGWKGAIALENAASDPVTTAVVLRGYAAVRAQIAGVTTSGGLARSYLIALPVASLSALQKAQVALALVRWTVPVNTDADTLLNNLDITQAADGSWGQDPYTTAIALHALAARLGLDVPALQVVVTIPDLALRAAINLALGKNRLDLITVRDLQSLTSLDANGFGIQSLQGIQGAINLASISLLGNNITDLSPLSGISGLTIINDGLCDVDADGQITVHDAQRTLRASTGHLTLTPAELDAADVQPAVPDGIVRSADSLAVLRAAAGFPVPACVD
jgi:hypothetical protein